MSLDRRGILGLTGAGVSLAVAGCLSGIDGPNGAEPAVEAATTPFVTHTDRPAWDEASDHGRVTVVDSEDRERAVIGQYDLSESRREAVREFLSGIDYDHERLVLVESAGPDACHDELEFASIEARDGRIRAAASVVDSSDDETACATVVVFPSALARITFEDEPLDAATVELTDGWDETATVDATASDRIGPDIDTLEGYIRPDGDPDPIDPLECDADGVERHPAFFDDNEVTWGDVEHDGDPALALRIGETEYGYGDTARIRLTNVADRTIDTGNGAKYNLQAYTEAGWQDIRVGDEDRFFEYTDEAIVHYPGEGFEWSIELTESAVAAAAAHDHVEVCPDLEPGRYRFVYWGAIDGAVAVAFDLK